MKILRKDVETIVNRKKNGETASKIALDYGVTVHAIYKVIAKWEMEHDPEILACKEALKKSVLLHKTSRMMEEAGVDQNSISNFLEKQKPDYELISNLRKILTEKEQEIFLLREKLAAQK